MQRSPQAGEGTLVYGAPATSIEMCAPVRYDARVNESTIGDSAQSYVPPVQMEGRHVMAHRGKLLVAAAVFVLSLGYLGFIAFQGASAYSLTVGELAERGDSVYGENLRVSGKLVESSFVRDESGTLVHFSLADAEDGSRTMNVVYDGLLPDLFFNEHSEIVLQGTYASNGTFDAQSILVKCPSKYEAEAAA